MDLELLKQKKSQEAVLSNRKTQYIKDKVFEYSDLWWKEFEIMMHSENKDERKTALAEFNKLQCRVLPTEIKSPDGEGLVVKVVSSFAQHAAMVANWDINAIGDEDNWIVESDVVYEE